MYIEIIKNWRQAQSAQEHDPHKFKVLNRVFCSGGTILPLNGAGETQVPEGDALFMKEFCPHGPPELTTGNKDHERHSIIAYSCWTAC